ncbi:hypothetical protein [Roseateles microcysteis]|uniref:hypothetical protein n=1 Tax=Roseateles microcysteis TaxID=3119057 RepID=UPI002FE5D058
MPSIRHHWPDLLPTAEAVEQLIAALKSGRKVRPVVTPSGHRARGHFPSFKGKKTRYESLVENDALCIFEIAASVLGIQTHPWVLDLIDLSGQTFHYTPDAFLTRRDDALLVEVKGDWLLKLKGPVDALLRTFRALDSHGVPIALLTEADIRAAGLQDELKELLRLRPVGGRNRTGLDTSLWDVLGGSNPNAQILKRWRDAQRECDALLERVMRRGPDEVVEAIAK